jgi:hypothetical protein
MYLSAPGRCGTDPFGHKWMLLMHIEDVSPQEMKKRMAEAFSTASAGSKDDKGA